MMTNNPNVSVIVPIYNNAKDLKRCICSLLKQSVDGLEIILVNDGSTDRSLELCRAFAKTNNNIRIFTTENHGTNHARNFGLDKAKGEYVGFVDADDYIEPDMYKIMFDSANSTIDIVNCDYVYEADKSIVCSTNIRKNEILSHKDLLSYVKEWHENHIIWFSWRNIFKRAFLESNAIRYNELFWEEATFMMKAIISAESYLSLDKLLYHYVKNENSILHRKWAENLEDGLESQYMLKKGIYASAELSNECWGDLSKNSLDHLLPMLINNARNNPNNNLLLNLRRIRDLKLIKESFASYSFAKSNRSKKHVLLILLFKYRLLWIVSFVYNYRSR